MLSLGIVDQLKKKQCKDHLKQILLKNFKDLDVEKAFITGWRLDHEVHIYVVENTERNEKSSFMSNESLLAS